MVIPIRKIISSLSNLMTIEPGDIISTGIPAGVVMSMKEPKYLKHDDVVEITIEKLGTIKTKFLLFDSTATTASVYLVYKLILGFFFNLFKFYLLIDDLTLPSHIFFLFSSINFFFNSFSE